MEIIPILLKGWALTTNTSWKYSDGWGIYVAGTYEKSVKNELLHRIGAPGEAQAHPEGSFLVE